jgi:transcriptional/translational regulatory protein YebC/TACO1
MIYTADTDLAAVAQALEAALGEAGSAKLIWKPSTTTELDLEAAQKMLRLIETLEDDDDVQSVTANFEVSDAVMAAL